VTAFDQRRAIELLHSDWIALEREGKFTTLTRFLAPEIIVQPEGRAPITGWDDVTSEFFSIDGPNAKIESEIVYLGIHEDAAVKIAAFDVKGTDGHCSKGFHTWFLVNTADRVQNWRIRYICWTFTRNGL